MCRRSMSRSVLTGPTMGALAIVTKKQISLLDGPALAENERALDDVFQLSYISRPGVLAQASDGGIAELAGDAPIACTDAIDEITGEKRDIFAPLTQGRKTNRKYVQTVIRDHHEIHHS